MEVSILIKRTHALRFFEEGLKQARRTKRGQHMEIVLHGQPNSLVDTRPVRIVFSNEEMERETVKEDTVFVDISEGNDFQ